METKSISMLQRSLEEEKQRRKETVAMATQLSQELTTIFLTLKNHYVTAIDCDHKAKTDTIRCSCSIWTGTPQPSVDEAVNEWINHIKNITHAALQLAKGG